MTYQDTVFEKEEGIATITLNRPEKLNAISSGMREGIPKAIEEARQDDEIKVVILTGSGRGFCSGGDVSEQAAGVIGGGPAKTRHALLRPLGFLAQVLWNFEKPTIAAINGVAAGAGFSLALACDMRIASQNARFTMAFVRRGLVPDTGATYFLPRVVGVAKACELMLIGDMIDAAEAERIGLVSRVVPHEDLMGVTRELAMRIAKGPSVAIELTKRAIYRSLSADLASQLEFESYAQNKCIQTEDHKEGVSAFLEKREAVFKGM